MIFIFPVLILCVLVYCIIEKNTAGSDIQQVQETAITGSQPSKTKSFPTTSDGENDNIRSQLS